MWPAEGPWTSCCHGCIMAFSLRNFPEFLPWSHPSVIYQRKSKEQRSLGNLQFRYREAGKGLALEPHTYTQKPESSGTSHFLLFRNWAQTQCWYYCWEETKMPKHCFPSFLYRVDSWNQEVGY